MLDYRTLLISLGVSTLCLLVTLFATWLARRGDGFLLTWVLGLAFLVAAIFCYSYYTEFPSAAALAASFSPMLVGFAIIYAAAFQFRTDRSPVRHVAVAGLVSLPLTLAPIIVGYDGIGFIMLNLCCASMLFGTAVEYARGRREAPGALLGMSLLYALTGFSFAVCAVVIAADGRWVMGSAPENWAETFNTSMSIAGMTGIGAMSLMVHQARITARHRREAITDALTGLYNRRALFELHARDLFTDDMAVIVFDIDRFKAVNDQYGHAVGDEVIRCLAEDLKDASGLSTTARLGGEEFAAVLRTAAPGYAEWLAERIRRNFAERELSAGDARFRVTVSAGIAYGFSEGRDFDGILNAADAALYEAKRNGRNRVQRAADHPRQGSRTSA
ncbi:diguanylate cyclase [Rhizobium sp. SGZ-381]|uniref:GGDEF domain-containing protein n=1 Tax=Rhizobium sp. SGZ-381 TaxID=3342800 RepID=UPI0036733220